MAGRGEIDVNIIHEQWLEIKKRRLLKQNQALFRLIAVYYSQTELEFISFEKLYIDLAYTFPYEDIKDVIPDIQIVLQTIVYYFSPPGLVILEGQDNCLLRKPDFSALIPPVPEQ